MNRLGRSALLLSCEAAKQLLGGCDVLFLDARPWSRYRKGHLPGAVNVDLFTYHWMDTSPRGLRAFTRHMETVFAAAGVSLDHRIVFYEDLSGMIAARGVWTLQYLGHPDAALLDGGLRRWRKLGFPTDTTSVPPTPTNFKAKPRRDLLADRGSIAARLGQPKLLLLDARSPDEYYGHTIRASRGGCIPGAVNVEWRRNLRRDGTFKDPPDLATLYRQSGLSEDHEIITYCQGGYRSAHAYLALRLAGYPTVRNYIGSWAEWGNRLDLPVERPAKTGSMQAS